ncbi:MAG: hypothetical protein ACK5LV_10745 [Lachnospirales bacterium]
MRDGKVRMQSSDPSLNDKFRAKVIDPDSPVYWYIKFNITLDPESISETTTYVTDLGGYILNSYIEYDVDKNIISISPLDTYEQEYYYLLHITTGVRSAKGIHLKRQINILFKLIDDKISEHKILRDEQVAPKPKTRPKNYNPYNVKSKVYGFEEDMYTKMKGDVLPFGNSKINPILGLVGVFVLVVALFTTYMPFIFFSVFIAAGGIIHLVMQLFKPKMRAVSIYNKGVRKFNFGDYEEAFVLFERAFTYDKNNEMIEYAIERAKFHSKIV